MPELPEVETVRRMLAACIPGRRIARAVVSRHRLRSASLAKLPVALAGRVFGEPRRTGKFLFLDLDGGLTLLSHLGMSGRWLYWPDARTADREMPHVHLRLAIEGGAALWYQDIRRFGMLRVVPLERLARDPSIRRLGPDPLAEPPTGESLHTLARGARVAVKNFLLDQRRIAGLGNIYVSEVLFRAALDPRRRAGTLSTPEWTRVASEIRPVLEASIERMGTTFSSYRTIWNEPGGYGERLLVYDRAGEPCRRCGAVVRRIVQGGRATFFCPACQSRRPAVAGPRGPRPARAAATRRGPSRAGRT